MISGPASRLRTVVLAFAWIMLAEPATAQTPTPVNARDEAAVARVAKDYLAALDRGDAKAIAEFWTRDGTYIDENGQTFNARELITTTLAADSKNRPHVTMKNRTVRFIAADVAIEEGDCEVPGQASSAIKGRFSALWVRQNDKWKLESLREWRTQTNPSIDQLAILEPLVGDWTGQIGNLNLRMSAKWNLSKTFLCRELSTTGDAKATFGGTQQIGWDPVTQQIRSWGFNNDGSRSEGAWSLEGNVWMVATTGVLPDGKIATATHILKLKDKDKLVYKSINGSVDDQTTPDFEITLTRQPPAK